METLTTKTCLICNRIFHPKLTQVKIGRGKICSLICRHKYQAVVMSGRRMKLEAKRKLIKALKSHKRTDTHSKNISKALIGKFIGENNPNWSGGRHKSQGRWYIRASNHPFKHKNGYILQSHYMVEKILNRYLTRKERIHHINYRKDDDRPENLYLFPSDLEHTKYHQLIKLNQVKAITESNLLNYQRTFGNLPSVFPCNH